MTDTETAQQWCRVAEAHRDLWAAHAGTVTAENARLRARIRQLEETVRLLHVQLPLMPFALGPHPDGPDPRWTPDIPTQRDVNDPDGAATSPPHPDDEPLLSPARCGHTPPGR